MMTADEIRQRTAADLGDVVTVQVDSGRVMALALMTWLPELVAQCAELQQELRAAVRSLDEINGTLTAIYGVLMNNREDRTNANR